MKASLGQEAFASALAFVELNIGLLLDADADADARAGAPNGAGEGVILSQPAPSPEERVCMGEDAVQGVGDRGPPDPLRAFGYWIWHRSCCCWWNMRLRASDDGEFWDGRKPGVIMLPW